MGEGAKRVTTVIGTGAGWLAAAVCSTAAAAASIGRAAARHRGTVPAGQIQWPGIQVQPQLRCTQWPGTQLAPGPGCST